MYVFSVQYSKNTLFLTEFLQPNLLIVNIYCIRAFSKDVDQNNYPYIID